MDTSLIDDAILRVFAAVPMGGGSRGTTKCRFAPAWSYSTRCTRYKIINHRIRCVRWNCKAGQVWLLFS